AGRTLAGVEQPIPTLRKDFVVDPRQVFEARAAGAGGLLLIAELLVGPARSAPAEELLDAAAEAGLWVLIEAFHATTVRAAVALARAATGRGVFALVGVNVRNLRTLALDPERRAAGIA